MSDLDTFARRSDTRTAIDDRPAEVSRASAAIAVPVHGVPAGELEWRPPTTANCTCGPSRDHSPPPLSFEAGDKTEVQNFTPPGIQCGSTSGRGRSASGWSCGGGNGAYEDSRALAGPRGRVEVERPVVQGLRSHGRHQRANADVVEVEAGGRRRDGGGSQGSCRLEY